MVRSMAKLAPALALIVVLGAVTTPVVAQIVPEPPPTCLVPISKNFCDANLQRGVWSVPVCATPTGTCFTLTGDNAHLSGALVSSGANCSNAERCDQAPSIVGALVVTGLDLKAQRHAGCTTARGHWSGDYIVASSSGLAQVQGTVWATLAAGTHRKIDCNGNQCIASDDCETCQDANVLPSPTPIDIRWRIGSEGHLDGRVLIGRFAGCTVHASLAGDFIANGDTRGPLRPDPAWEFCGAIEGVLECPCTVLGGEAADPELVSP